MATRPIRPDRPRAILSALAILLSLLSTVTALTALTAALSALTAVPARAGGPDTASGAAPYAYGGATGLTVSAGDRRFEALVLWPAMDTDAGDDGPRGSGPWPVVIFSHGYLSPVELYTGTLRELATRGFIVVAPRSGGELFPDHAAIAADISTVIDWFEVETALEGGMFTGAVALDRIGVAGHSMGGGVSLLAAAADPRIRTVATLAAAETRPSAIGAAGRIRVPMLFIAGELDAITPIARHQRPMFESSTDTHTQMRIIVGGSHCGFTEPSSGGVVGALSGLVCDTATIPSAAQLSAARRLLVDWFRSHLGGAPGDGTVPEQRRP